MWPSEVSSVVLKCQRLIIWAIYKTFYGVWDNVEFKIMCNKGKICPSFNKMNKLLLSLFSGSLLFDFIVFGGIYHSGHSLHKMDSRLDLADFWKSCTQSLFSCWNLNPVAWISPPAERRMIPQGKGVDINFANKLLLCARQVSSMKMDEGHLTWNYSQVKNSAKNHETNQKTRQSK